MARACDTDLKSFAQELLFSPLDAEVGEWYPDAGLGRLLRISYFGRPLVKARDMAKARLDVYLNEGEYEGEPSHFRPIGSGIHSKGTRMVTYFSVVA